MTEIEETLEYIKKSKALMDALLVREENLEVLAVSTLLGVAEEILELELKNPSAEEAAE